MTVRIVAAGNRSWNRTCSSVMPVHSLPFVSGTRMNVLPSRRPLATTSSRPLATLRFVPLSAAFVSTLLRRLRARPPRSTTSIELPVTR